VVYKAESDVNVVSYAAIAYQ